jgi:hypothetical protein
VIFGNDKKGKVFGTGVIKVNNNFTLKDIALVDKLGYNLVLQCLILVVTLFVVFLASGWVFKLIFLFCSILYELFHFLVFV